MRVWPLFLVAAGIASGQTLPQDRLRKGMAEAGIRTWTLQRDAGSTGLVAVSTSRFVTDNVSAGILAGGLSDSLTGSILVQGMARLYVFPLQSLTPWFEARFGGLMHPEGGRGATNLGIGFGWRWRPAEWIALDLQLVGAERWAYDDPAEGGDGTTEWLLQKSPILLSSSGATGWRLVPVPSVQILF